LAATVIPPGASGEIEVLLAEVRSLTAMLLDALGDHEEAKSEYKSITASMLKHFDELPDLVARGISSALMTQHRLIMKDVHEAFDKLAAELKGRAPEPER
jgi:L-serine deaminase